MSNPEFIAITKHGPEGAGCYSCSHFLRCSLRLRMDAVIRDHIGWFDVDGRPPAWQGIVYATGEACTLYERQTNE